MNGCKACLCIIKNDKPIFYLSDIYMSSNTPCDKISIKEKLADCVPELRDIVNNAVICKRCVISLTAAYNFRQQCLEVQQKVCSYLQQMPVNTIISMEQVALYYKRQEVIVEEGNPIIEAIYKSNTCSTANDRNMVIKMEKLPVMQEENLITEVVYKTPNTCETPKKPVRNMKMEKPPMQEEFVRQGENSLTAGVDFMPNELTMYSQIQSLQQHATMYLEYPVIDNANTFSTSDGLYKYNRIHPEYPVIDNANTFSTSYGLYTYNRIQDSAMIPNDMYNNMTENFVMQKPPRKAKKSAKKPMINCVCNTCDYKCMSENLLKRHYRIHDERYHIQCPSCKFRSKSVHALKAHTKSKHAVKLGAKQHIPEKSKKKTKKAKKQERLEKQKQLETKMLPVSQHYHRWMAHVKD